MSATDRPASSPLPPNINPARAGDVPVGGLCLTRRLGEAITIGPPEKPIGTVYVSQLRSDRVRLAFNIPGVEVNRTEVAHAKVKEARRRAAR